MFFNTPPARLRRWPKNSADFERRRDYHDVGSVKAGVIGDIKPLLQDRVHLVPGHPIAGTEQSGPDAGFAGYLRDAVHLTPEGDANLYAVETIANLWRQMGSEVEFMDAGHHDLVLAITSHLPHLIAIISSARAQLENDTRSAVLNTRPAVSAISPVSPPPTRLCGAIFFAKQRGRAGNAGRFSEDLTALQRAIRHGDGDYLENTSPPRAPSGAALLKPDKMLTCPISGATSATPAN